MPLHSNLDWTTQQDLVSKGKKKKKKISGACVGEGARKQALLKHLMCAMSSHFSRHFRWFMLLSWEFLKTQSSGLFSSQSVFSS